MDDIQIRDGLFASYRKKEKSKCIGDCNKWNDAMSPSTNSGFNWGYIEVYDAIFASTDSGFNCGYIEVYDAIFASTNSGFNGIRQSMNQYHRYLSKWVKDWMYLDGNLCTLMC